MVDAPGFNIKSLSGSDILPPASDIGINYIEYDSTAIMINSDFIDGRVLSNKPIGVIRDQTGFLGGELPNFN